MPIVLVVTFMDKGPPKVRPKSPLDVEPEDKTIILNIAGGVRPIFQTDDLWFQNYIKKFMSWAVGKKIRAIGQGSQIIVTWS